MTFPSLKHHQLAFLEAEVWRLAFEGAFQRVPDHVYCTPNEAERADAREKLRRYLERSILPQYKVRLGADDHVANIASLCAWSQNALASVLQGNGLTFGVAQKLINLVLKYFWCLGWIPEPPHCPVDSSVVQALGPQTSVTSWSTMSEPEYVDIIQAIGGISHLSGDSIAEWELELWNRP